jgi:hypothetical protein
MPAEGVTKSPEEQLFQLLQSIKEDTEYIKRRLSIEKVDSEELTETETSDLEEAIRDFEQGKAVNLDEL